MSDPAEVLHKLDATITNMTRALRESQRKIRTVTGGCDANQYLHTNTCRRDGLDLASHIQATLFHMMKTHLLFYADDIDQAMAARKLFCELFPNERLEAREVALESIKESESCDG